MPYDEDAFWVPFGGQSRWMAKPGAFAARAPKWLLAPPRTVHVIAQGTPRADDGFWCCDEGDSVLVVPLWCTRMRAHQYRGFGCKGEEPLSALNPTRSMYYTYRLVSSTLCPNAVRYHR